MCAPFSSSFRALNVFDAQSLIILVPNTMRRIWRPEQSDARPTHMIPPAAAFHPSSTNHQQPIASPCPTASPTNRAPICCSTPTTRWIGIPGARRRSSGPRREDKPIFLSIGYSACHWCHVMEHESFENAAIAELMNEHFVCVKVDREERPDLDQIYMNAVQLMTGRGGWPMSVFLTPELKPFYGGTYWPPTGARGHAGLRPGACWPWTTPGRIAARRRSSRPSRSPIIWPAMAAGPAEPKDLPPALVARAAGAMLRSVRSRARRVRQRAEVSASDGSAAAGPRLVSQSRRARPLHVITHTLDKMAAGGIYDQLGGGFHRYSIDERWLVPHFEKMLYDNALLVPCYLEAYLITGDADYARVAGKRATTCCAR